MVLDETRTAGESGHLSDHNSLHDFYNAAVTAGVFDEATGTYKDTSPLFLGAGDLEGHLGSPSVVRVGSRYASWALDDTAQEQIGGGIVVPERVSTFDVYLWYTTLTGNAGDVNSITYIYAPAAGGSLAAQDHAISNTFTVSVAANGLAVFKLNTTALAATAGPTLVTFNRSGGNAGDTLVGDINVLGIELRQVS